MKIFIDSNIFYNNWFAENANFNLFFQYINNNNYCLVISQLVIEEVNNLRNREIDKLRNAINNASEKLKSLSKLPIDFRTDQFDSENYSLQGIIEERVHNIEYLEFENVQHSEIVKRAINQIKPFTDKEKGYRDTLIWLSLINHLSENNCTEEVIFITNNKNDFYDLTCKNTEFNSDLKSDISYRKINITPFISIKDFIEKRINRASHSFDHGEILDSVEGFLDYAIENHLCSLKNHEISDLLGSSIFKDNQISVVEVQCSIIEGLEDPYVNFVDPLSEQDVYISSTFEMRTVAFLITISKTDYDRHKDQIATITYIHNHEVSGENIILHCFFRSVYVEASFEYNTSTHNAHNFTLETISL